MTRYIVGSAEILPPGSRRVVTAGGRQIAVFNVSGRFYAVRNVCPHHGAPLCTHGVRGTMVPSDPHVYEYGRDDEIVRCPWHGYEFEIASGRAIVDGSRMRVKTYDVALEGNDVVVYI